LLIVYCNTIFSYTLISLNFSDKQLAPMACVYTAKLMLKCLHSTHKVHICELHDNPDKEPVFLYLVFHYFSFEWNKTLFSVRDELNLYIENVLFVLFCFWTRIF